MDYSGVCEHGQFSFISDVVLQAVSGRSCKAKRLWRRRGKLAGCVPDARFIRTFIYSDAFLDILHDSFLGVAQS